MNISGHFDLFPTWYPWRKRSLSYCGVRQYPVGGFNKRFWFTQYICIFFVDGPYGIDVKFVVTFEPTVTTKERDTERFYAFLVHANAVLDYFSCISQNKILEGNLGEGVVSPGGGWLG